MVTTGKIVWEGCGSKQFDVLSSWVELRSSSLSLDRSAPSLGCQCKVIGGTVYYGPSLPKLAWIEDQLQFELIIKEVSIRNARLQLYQLLSLVSSDGWDDAGSTSSFGDMSDQPFEKGTSQSSNTTESIS